MARVRDEPLEVDDLAAEGGLRLGRGAPHGLGEVLGALHAPNALPAAAPGGLHEERIAHAVSGGDDGLRVGGVAHLGAGNHRHARRLGRSPRAHLVAHRAHRGGGGPDERHPRGVARLAEGGVLGEESVARVDGVGARLLARGEDRVDV